MTIEHNMEIIRNADYVIDLGPEGGDEGGKVLYTGPLKGLLNCKDSHTGKCLKEHLKKTNGLKGVGSPSPSV